MFDLTTTQRWIVIALVVLAVLVVLWLYFGWRPRHRRRQADTATELFREDHLGDWARVRLSEWTTDQREAALRYYSTVGRQARSGAIRPELVPENHHATIVALAAQETQGGTKETSWGEVAWLGRAIDKRRDDLSIRWVPR